VALPLGTKAIGFFTAVMLSRWTRCKQSRAHFQPACLVLTFRNFFRNFMNRLGATQKK
jgi:hypothetical protein